MRAAAALLLPALVLAGCIPPSASPAPQKPPVDCLEAGAGMGDALDRERTGTAIVEESMWSQAVRLPHPEPIYLVAIEFQVRGLGKLTGVWATTSLEGQGGDFLAVDETAQRFTDWPDADKSPANISPTDPYVAKARFCADGNPAHLKTDTGTVVR